MVVALIKHGLLSMDSCLRFLNSFLVIGMHLGESMDKSTIFCLVSSIGVLGTWGPTSWIKINVTHDDVANISNYI
jgi:hypothetical protein